MPAGHPCLPDKPKHRAQSTKWAKENRGNRRSAWARYQADKLRAFPVWADTKKINAIYDEAARLTRETGIPHEVDHIYPLRSKVMCGLHVEANLRVIPMPVNRSKSNRWWPGCEPATVAMGV